MKLKILKLAPDFRAEGEVTVGEVCFPDQEAARLSGVRAFSDKYAIRRPERITAFGAVWVDPEGSWVDQGRGVYDYTEYRALDPDSVDWVAVYEVARKANPSPFTEREWPYIVQNAIDYLRQQVARRNRQIRDLRRQLRR
jgi:hypothetical protein